MNTEIKAKDRLEKAGIKASYQRMAILSFLINNPIHPTVDTIYNNLYPSIPTLSRTTVYNTLKLLEEQGVIRLLLIDEKNTRYDADLSSHAHFKCKNCGLVLDLPLDFMDEKKIKKYHPLQITSCEIQFQGYCEECSKKMN
ncbi:transcriptional repressor [Bacteroidales bacterium OttesenSCG-928-A17]|nr:transcriptional repressor [Bacteroidales bacterium OttesenSCG-928-A17]